MAVAASSHQRAFRFPPSAPPRIRSLAQLPSDLLRQHPRPDLLQQCTADGLKPSSTAAFVERVRAIGLALEDMGMAPGDRVAIMSETRQEWVLADMGLVTARLVTVPVYPTLSGPQARYILEDSGARGLFVSDAVQAEKILTVRHLLPDLEFIVVFTDEVPPSAVRGSHTVLRLEGVIERGRALAGDPAAVARYEAGIDAVEPDDLLTLIYTSGTTGEPKGVMLTHENVLSNLRAVVPVLDLQPQDVALSYLPLSHVFERMVTYLYLHEGLSVCHAESLDTLAREQGVHLVLPSLADPAAAWADPGRVRQILINLLSNAIKYNRHGGSVTVRLAPQADALLVEVSDTGVGIPDNQRDALFEPFNRLGQQHGPIVGSGIGLAVTRALVSAMQGHITVQSTPGEGSVFGVTLPIGPGPEPRQAA